MKTAISIPDPLFQAAELLAQELSVSRSELYSNAIRDYLAAYKNHRVTDALNSIYAVENNSLEPKLEKLQSESLDKSFEKDEW